VKESIVRHSGGLTCREGESSLGFTSATITRFLPRSQSHRQLQRGSEELQTAGSQQMGLAEE